MRAVEDPPLRVAPAPGEEPEAHRPVRDVRRREHEPAVGLEERPHAGEEPLGRRADARSDRRTGRRRTSRSRTELHRLDVADQHLRADVSGRFRRALVLLDPDDRAAALDERSREIPARAPDVEHPRPRPDESQQLRVPTVGTLVERDVAALSALHMRSYAASRRRIASAQRHRRAARGRRRRRSTCMPSPSAVASSAVSYARPRSPKPLTAHSAPIATRPATRGGRARRPRAGRARGVAPRPRRSSSGSRSPIRTRAYVRAKTPSWITCAPISVSATNPSIVWICHVRPKTSTGPLASTSIPASPSRSRMPPGRGTASSGCTGA